MFLSSRDAKKVIDRLLARSRADACEIAIFGVERRNLRFARGAATTNAASSEIVLRVSSHIGQRVGHVQISSLNPAAGLQALERSERLARLTPPDPHYAAALGSQKYDASARYDEATAMLGVDALAAYARAAIEAGSRSGVETFGSAAVGRQFRALATSLGNHAYDRESICEISVTARNRLDSWSGWAGANEFCARRLDYEGVARRACAKAAWEGTPRDLEPGSYTVVFEPAATAELLRWLLWMLDARAADEGRSFFSRAGGSHAGGSRLGERLFDPKLEVRSDPCDPLAPAGPFSSDGLPERARHWIDGGALMAMHCDRAHAARGNCEPIPAPRSFRMAGGPASVEDIIAGVEHGVLVTRLWYSNMLDPRSLLLTGLTRDGNFIIEKGRVVAPARNMRFNARLGEVFGDISALGATQRTWASFDGGGVVAAPAMRIDAFPLVSRSSGV